MWSPFLFATTVWSFAHLPLRLSDGDRNNTYVWLPMHQSYYVYKIKWHAAKKYSQNCCLILRFAHNFSTFGHNISLLLATTDNQFGFKAKHGTDMCLFLLKQTVSDYVSKDTPVFSAFIIIITFAFLTLAH